MTRNSQIKPSLQEFRQPLGRHEAELRQALNHFSIFAKGSQQADGNEEVLSQQLENDIDSGLRRR